MSLVFNPITGQLDIVDKKKAVWGGITGTLSDQTDLQDALDTKVDVSALNSNITLYPTNVASDIGGYYKLVDDIEDPEYNTTAVDIATGAIAGTDQLIASLASSAGVFVGNPGIFNVTIIGNIRKFSGATSTDATFHFELYKRNAAGTESLILVSGETRLVTQAIYVQFDADGVFNDGSWLATDRVVLKFYGTKVGGGVDPVYEFQFGGTTPVRALLPVPVSVAISGKEDVGVAATLDAAHVAAADPHTQYVKKAGDTMTGALGIGTAPSYLLDVYGTTTNEGINTNIGLNFQKVENPTSGSAAVILAAGNVDAGDHTYWITYYTALGETNSFRITITPITTDATHGQVDVTIPISSDPRVIGRKIYRTKAGTAYYLDYLLATVADNTSTSYIDNIADSSLTGDNFQSARINTTNKYITVNDASVMLLDNAATTFGIGTGAALTTAGNSTFFGTGAGTKVTTGNGNTFFGNSAGRNVTTGADNICIGSQAGRDMSTGSNNVFIGRNNALSHAVGNENVCVGPYAMALASGTVSGNASLGMSTLRNITTGPQNIAVGRQSGYDITTGGYNITIGSQGTTGVGITTGSYNILMGYNVYYGLSQTGSNQLNIGNLIFGTGLGVGNTLSTGDIGIGVIPTAKLDVAGPIKTLGYTVATLPTGVVGMRAYVTDATAPTYLGALTGGGAVVAPVFYNGAAWVSA